MGLPHVLPPVLLQKRLGSLGPLEQQPPSRCASGPGLCSLYVPLWEGAGLRPTGLPCVPGSPGEGPPTTETPGSIRPQA